MSTTTPSTWKSQAGFVWSLIGSAVGFANILSFSAKAYKNGGGAYLIPYAFALFAIGIPFLILEGKIGHRFKSPLVPSYGIVWGKIGKILGWLSVLSCLTIGAFYIVLTGYAASYTFLSSAGLIPDDTKTFFLGTFLRATESVRDFGSFSWLIFSFTALVGLLSWFVLRRKVRDGLERICSIFMPLLCLSMIAFAVVATCLPGGIQGWVYYLTPDFSKLTNPKLWCDVFGQLFFSLSLGLGIIVGYARHTGETANIGRAMMYVALGDFFISFISGAAIFACLAHISHTQGIPFQQILTTDSTFEIGFILFPKILKAFGPFFSQLIGGIFFFSVFIAGITGVFSIVESIAGNAEFEFRLTRQKAVASTLCVMLLASLLFCFGNAPHLIDALAPMVLGTNMLIGGIALIFAFSHKVLLLENRLMRLSLHVFVPIVLAGILAGNIWQEWSEMGAFQSIRWTWFLAALVLASGLTVIRRAKTQLA